MHIEPSQYSLIQEVAHKLDQLGIYLGVLHPNGAFMHKDVEFVLRYPTSEYDTHQLLHKDDIIFRREGNMLVHEPVSDPKHDDEVQTLLDTINEAILEGEISFDPAVTREVEGFGTIQITQRDLTSNPNIGQCLYELPLASPRGNLWAYGIINELAQRGDERFIKMKKIIDDVWPEEAERLFRSQVAEQADKEHDLMEDTQVIPTQPAVKPTKVYMPSKLMRNFWKWLGMQ